MVKFHQSHETRRNLNTGAGCGSGMQHWLLRLLHVFVVGERQSFHGCNERYLAADEPRGFSPNQLQRVRILLLRHCAAAGGVCLRQFDEAILLGSEESELFSPAAQMDTQQRKHVYKFDHEIPITCRIHAVGRGFFKAKLAARDVPIQRQRRTGNRRGTQWRLVCPPAAVAQAFRISPQHLKVRQYPMRYQNRLSALQVGIGGHNRRLALLCSFRLRPLCNFFPVSPISSTSFFSTKWCTSSASASSRKPGAFSVALSPI